MSNYSGSVEFSDFSFIGKITLFFTWIIKSSVLFALFSVLLLLKNSLIRNSEYISDACMTLAIIVVIYSLAFLVFYILSEHILKDMILGMIISIVGAVLAMIIPPVGIVIAIIGIISMIRKIISVIKMIPMLLLGILFAVFLFADALLAYYGILSTSEIYANPIRYTLLGTRIVLPRIMVGYIGLSLLTSLVLAFKYSLKNAMLRQVVIFMAIPITALIIYLAKTFMANAFYQPGEIQQSGIHRGKIWVNDYTRADGTLVHVFWRHLPMKK